MIVNIRGTSGSGKTHLTREIMARYINRTPHFLTEPIEYDTLKRGRLTYEKRKQPLWYTMDHPRSSYPGLAVLGHYETACGGCDTIPQTDLIYKLADDRHSEGLNVMFEGLLLGGEHLRAREVEGLLVVVLTTPIETCLAAVNARRRARNPEATDVNPKNTVAKVATIDRGTEILAEQGVRVVRATREEALRLLCHELGFQLGGLEAAG